VSFTEVLATIGASMPVAVAIVFGILTLRQWQRTRYLTAAAELVKMMQTPEFSRSIALILELPERAEPESVARDPATVTAIYHISHVFESLGVLVFHRQLPLHLVDRLVGGYVRASWRRVGPYVETRRARMGAMFGEWFHWLAERLEERPAPGKKDGAWIAHRKWRP
jgi:hypothetical protein